MWLRIVVEYIRAVNAGTKYRQAVHRSESNISGIYVVTYCFCGI